MIVTEYYATRPDGVVLNITYSDSHFKIRSDSTGAVYDSAIDPADLNRTYTETDEPIPEEDIPAEEALRILMGGEV